MATNEPMSDDMLTDDEREIITEEYIRSVKRELAEALAEVDRLRAREQALEAEDEDADGTLVQAVQEMKRLNDENTRLRAENAAMRPIVEAIIAAQNAVTSAEARWHQVTRTDSYPESEVRQTDRQRLTALRTRDTAIEQARAFITAHPTAAGEAESEGE